MSIEALVVKNHKHGLKDDLESFIYVVLYAALRWLPVESLGRLDWWLTDFFGVPDPHGYGGGTSAKSLNALRRSYTSSLSSTESVRVVEWLNDAMNLHYKGQAANPLWDDGKALKEMWERCLAGNLPCNDRCVNPVDGMRFREGPPIRATHTVTTSSTKLYGSHVGLPGSNTPAPGKRPRAVDDGGPDTAQQSRPGKRPRT